MHRVYIRVRRLLSSPLTGLSGHRAQGLSLKVAGREFVGKAVLKPQDSTLRFVKSKAVKSRTLRFVQQSSKVTKVLT